MKRKSLVIPIILLAVGFAAVTTTLVINGNSIFGTNDDEFDVIFTKAIVDGVNKTSTVISEDGKSITYETKELAIKDDTSILEFTVKNTSTQYDAEVAIECIGGVSEGTYYKIEKDLVDYVPAQSSEDGSIVVTMIKSSTEPIEETFTCTITANAVERNTLADIEYDTEVTWSDEDDNQQISLGDIISLSKEDASTEEFYVIDANDENIEMMSMYNLYVGAEYDGTNVIPYENSAGIQDSKMLGWVSAGTPYRGTTAFSNTSIDYEGSIVKTYVNSYSEYLSNTLGIENTATLISKEELEEILGTTLNVGDYLNRFDAPAFLYSTSYWTRSPYDTSRVLHISTASYLNYHTFDYGERHGVCPIVTIDTSLIEVPTKVCNETGNICWIDGDNSTTKTLGDVVTLGTDKNSIEQFYILSASDEVIELMSMYNLYVGAQRTDITGASCTAYENPTGIQKSSMIGYTNLGAPYKGVTAFTKTSTNYEGSTVEGYVNYYHDYLKNTLKIENTATLITKEKLENIIGQTLNEGDNLATLGVSSFLYRTTYWTRTVSGDDVWRIHSVGAFGVLNGISNYSGVRPVVIIPATLV